MQKETPLRHMFHTFVILIVFIIAAVSVFNFVIYGGKLPGGMVYQNLRDIGERCGEENVCFEPLQCRSNTCVLLVPEKGGRCNDYELVCVDSFVCDQHRCKEFVGINRACDVSSFQVCDDGLECLDGVCRRIIAERINN